MKWLAFLLLFGCYSITGYDQQPEMTKAGMATHLDVNVVWVDSVDEVNRICPPQPNWMNVACARPKVDGDYSKCTIYALKPKDFNDVPKLAILGHELMHCTGAEHRGR
jgi:hypothetical protein